MAALPAPDSGVARADQLVLRAAVSAYLDRYRGQTRLHTESDLRVFLCWCTDQDLDPLAAVRMDIEQYVRWLQDERQYQPSTVSRRLSVLVAVGWTSLWRVFLPVASPGLVACAMFAFMSSWGEFLYALLFTSTMNSKTMPIIIASFVTDVDTSPVLMNAGGVLAVIPPLVLALIFQRLIVSGITAGAVKG